MTEYDKRISCTEETKNLFKFVTRKLNSFLNCDNNQDEVLNWLIENGLIILKNHGDKKPRLKTPKELDNVICDIHDHRIGVQSDGEIKTIKLLMALNGDYRWNAYFHGKLYLLFDKNIDELTRDE